MYRQKEHINCPEVTTDSCCCGEKRTVSVILNAMNHSNMHSNKQLLHVLLHYLNFFNHTDIFSLNILSLIFTSTQYENLTPDLLIHLGECANASLAEILKIIRCRIHSCCVKYQSPTEGDVYKNKTNTSKILHLDRTMQA